MSSYSQWEYFRERARGEAGVRGSLHEDREFAGGEGAGDVIMPEPLPL
jgi:hypothetical protein